MEDPPAAASDMDHMMDGANERRADKGGDASAMVGAGMEFMSGEGGVVMEGVSSTMLPLLIVLIVCCVLRFLQLLIVMLRASHRDAITWRDASLFIFSCPSLFSREKNI